jgi:hypothetical protein
MKDKLCSPKKEKSKNGIIHKLLKEKAQRKLTEIILETIVNNNLTCKRNFF